MYGRTATAPVTVKLTAGATTLTLRVSRADAKPLATFTVLAGDALPAQVAAATERKLAALRRQATVMKVERTPLRGRTTVTLAMHDLPPPLTQEPYLLLRGERALITFPKGPPTCDRCWCSGHSRTQGCPHALAEASAQCSSCGQKGHAAAGCWLAAKECYHCHQRGHMLKHCPARTCYKCHHPGHIAAECPQRAPQETAQKKHKGGARAAQPAAAATQAAEPAAAADAEMMAAPEVMAASAQGDKRKRDEEGEEEAKEAPVDPALQEQRRARAARLMLQLGVKRNVVTDSETHKIVWEGRGRGPTSQKTLLQRDAHERMLTALLHIIQQGGDDASALAAAQRAKSAQPSEAELQQAPADAGDKEASGQQHAGKVRKPGAGSAGTVEITTAFQKQQERQQQQPLH
jgi:hypothetical protein